MPSYLLFKIIRLSVYSRMKSLLSIAIPVTSLQDYLFFRLSLIICPLFTLLFQFYCFFVFYLIASVRSGVHRFSSLVALLMLSDFISWPTWHNFSACLLVPSIIAFTRYCQLHRILHSILTKINLLAPFSFMATKNDTAYALLRLGRNSLSMPSIVVLPPGTDSVS